MPPPTSRPARIGEPQTSSTARRTPSGIDRQGGRRANKPAAEPGTAPRNRGRAGITESGSAPRNHGPAGTNESGPAPRDRDRAGAAESGCEAHGACRSGESGRG
ncbi:hypothetical protein Aab01nite_75340 [Paractinoplanes abujensis]|nr:hypothetical protein Aab01nite_75340 [Actinoplanes abujensis]